VRDAAWGCDWVGTPVSFQRCLAFIIAAASKEFTLTAGKFVPVSNKTMMNVITHFILGNLTEITQIENPHIMYDQSIRYEQINHQFIHTIFY
jgi:hypothetical protein